MSPIPKRETIYIDAEDEITSVIDKLKSAESKIVALVLPKRSATLQSAVNLKLLKRSAENTKKSLVLITSDNTIMSIAGMSGIHVAKTLQSKPEVPLANTAIEIKDSSDTVEQIDADLVSDEVDDKDPIEVDDTTDKAVDQKQGKIKKTRIKIPDFQKFRLRLIIAAVAILILIGLWVWAALFLPKATIVIKTDTSTFDAKLSFTAKADAEELDLEESILPATIKQIKKSSSQTVNTTGQRDEGKKATGTLTLTNCINDADSHTIPAGTGFSANELTFVTDKAVTLGPSSFDGLGECKSGEEPFASFNGSQKSVSATAIEGGEKYNVAASSYSPPAAFNGILASGSKMKGGTTKIVKIVSQSDIDAATQAIIDKLNPEATDELKAQFVSEQSLVLVETFNSSNPQVKSEPEVNKEADRAIVTATITYSQTGIKNEHLTKLIEKVTKDQIDETKQTIQNTGLENATIEINGNPKAKSLELEIETKVTAGPQLDAESIKQEIFGLKRIAAKEMIEARPGIIEANVEYSPFWVTSVPNKPNKIEIIFTQSDENNK